MVKYHEMCHAELEYQLPILHKLFNEYKKKENYIKCYTIMIYIEYFIKCLPYILAGIHKFNDLFSLIKNITLKERIMEGKKVMEKLSTTSDKLIDNYKILERLEEYVEQYIKND